MMKGIYGINFLYKKPDVTPLGLILVHYFMHRAAPCASDIRPVGANFQRTTERQIITSGTHRTLQKHYIISFKGTF